MFHSNYGMFDRAVRAAVDSNYVMFQSNYGIFHTNYGLFHSNHGLFHSNYGMFDQAVRAAVGGGILVLEGIHRLPRGILSATLGRLISERAVQLPDGSRLVPAGQVGSMTLLAGHAVITIEHAVITLEHALITTSSIKHAVITMRHAVITMEQYDALEAEIGADALSAARVRRVHPSFRVVATAEPAGADGRMDGVPRVILLLWCTRGTS